MKRTYTGLWLPWQQAFLSLFKVDAAAAAGLFFLDFNVESRNRLGATNEIELVAPFGR
jgi:hypothetical protein